MTGQCIQQEAICYQWFKQRLILSVSEPSISQRSQIKEDTVEPSVPAREFNLKTYAAITWHNDSASLGLEPRLADHRSQAARTATISTAPPRQAKSVDLLQVIYWEDSGDDTFCQRCGGCGWHCECIEGVICIRSCHSQESGIKWSWKQKVQIPPHYPLGMSQSRTKNSVQTIFYSVPGWQIKISGQVVYVHAYIYLLKF